jgi:pimeloyl-ACP methyl ester carboxylesterase
METVRSADETTIAFDRHGGGPPLVLVGGAFQHRALDATGERLATLLAPHATVLVYDRRGRGDSGDREPYAVAREVDDLAAVIAAAGGGGGGEAAVCGLSAGGALALAAVAAGLPVTRLVLWEPPFTPVGLTPPDHAALAPRYRALVGAGRHDAAVALFLTAAAGLSPGCISLLRCAPHWRALEAVAHTLAYDAAVLGDGRVPAARLAAISCETLVLTGAASPAAMRAAAAEVAAALPNGRLETLHDQTHAFDPAVVAPAVARFLAAPARAGAASR